MDIFKDEALKEFETVKPGDPEELETIELANYWAMVAARAHGIVADRLQTGHQFIGLSLVIVTAAGGTSAVSYLADIGASQPWITGLTASLTVVAALLSSLQAFLNFAERSAKHAKAAASLSSLAAQPGVLPEMVGQAVGEGPRVRLQVQKQARQEIDEELGSKVRIVGRRRFGGVLNFMPRRPGAWDFLPDDGLVPQFPPLRSRPILREQPRFDMGYYRAYRRQVNERPVPPRGYRTGPKPRWSSR